MSGLSAIERQAVTDLVHRLRRRLGARLCEVRVYGSKARQTAHPMSDVDVAVIVARHTADVREEVFTEVSAVSLAYDVLPDVHVLDAPQRERLRQLGSPYAAAIEEGTSL